VVKTWWKKTKQGEGTRRLIREKKGIEKRKKERICGKKLVEEKKLCKKVEGSTYDAFEFLRTESPLKTVKGKGGGRWKVRKRGKGKGKGNRAGSA